MHPDETVSEHSGTEVRLVERACGGDSDAQQVLWRAHRRWVAAIVMAHRPRCLDVDDLMQDVAVKFVSKISTLREPTAFRPWMRRIIVNVCRGAARSLRPTTGLNDEHDELSISSSPAFRARGRQADGDASVERHDAARTLLAQVMTLPVEYREPLVLRCVRALSYQQISEIMDLPVTTIETRLARARRMLREEIGDAIAFDGTVG